MNERGKEQTIKNIEQRERKREAMNKRTGERRVTRR